MIRRTWSESAKLCTNNKLSLCDLFKSLSSINYVIPVATMRWWPLLIVLPIPEGSGQNAIQCFLVYRVQGSRVCDSTAQRAKMGKLRSVKSFHVPPTLVTRPDHPTDPPTSLITRGVTSSAKYSNSPSFLAWPAGHLTFAGRHRRQPQTWQEC